MSNEFKDHDNSGQAPQESVPAPLDLQYLELIETVFACEKSARQMDRIESSIKYGR